MTHTSRISDNLGFLTIVDQPRLGLIGGYLVLNPAGRPLEFHCTTPVRPNRAQEILYGNTLEPFLFGERIARTLISRSKTPVGFVMINTAPALVVQDFIEIPAVYVFEHRKPQSEPKVWETEDIEEVQDGQTEPIIEISEQLNESLKSFGIEKANIQTKFDGDTEVLRIPDVPGLDMHHWKTVRVGNRNIALSCVDETKWTANVEELKQLSTTIDLMEPFTRIRMAIDEAQRVA